MTGKRKLSDLTPEETGKLINTFSKFKEDLDEEDADAKSVVESLAHVMSKLQGVAAQSLFEYRTLVKGYIPISTIKCFVLKISSLSDHELIVDTTSPHPPHDIDIHSMSEQDRSDAWRDLDKQVALLYAPIAELKTRRNALAPIARLPPEILTEIFMFVINLYHACCPRDAIRFLRLIGVCRYWRAMMMDSPRLWSSLLFSNAELTAHMLQRSKLLPLVVRADLAMLGVDREALKLALLHTSRIRVLQIRALALDKLLSEIDQPAPLLEFLRLANQNKYTTVTLPPLLFQDVTPRLRYFAVYDVIVPWYQLPRGLTHLEIRHYKYYPFQPGHGQSLPTLHNVLSNCPALATLILHNTLPWTLEDPPQSQCAVTLPQLSHLQLVGDLEDCCAVIHLISFPLTTTIVLRCILDEPPLLEPLQVLSKLGERRGIRFPNGSIHVESKAAESCVRFQLWTKADGNLNPLRVPLLDLSFVGDPSEDATEYTPLIHALCQGLSLTHLPRLEIDVSQLHEVPPHSWLTMLGCLNRLRALTVRASGVDGLFYALDLTGMNKMDEIFLSRLQSLTLHGARFTPEETLESLWSFLGSRMEMGMEVEILRLFKCINLYRGEVKELKQGNPTVRWDGIEQGGNSDDDEEEEEEEEEEEPEYYYEW
jgi:hypothetical protein